MHHPGNEDHVSIWLSNGEAEPAFKEQVLATTGSHFSKTDDIDQDADLWAAHRRTQQMIKERKERFEEDELSDVEVTETSIFKITVYLTIAISKRHEEMKNAKKN